MAIQDLLEKVRRLVRGRKGDIDKGLDKAERIVSEKTGGKYDSQMRSARQKADEALSDDAESDGANREENDHTDRNGGASEQRRDDGTERPPG